MKKIFFLLFIITQSLCSMELQEPNQAEWTLETLPKDILAEILFSHVLKLGDKETWYIIKSYKTFINLKRNKLFYNYLNEIDHKVNTLTTYQSWVLKQLSDEDFERLNKDILKRIFVFESFDQDLIYLVHFLIDFKKLEVNEQNSGTPHIIMERNSSYANVATLWVNEAMKHDSWNVDAKNYRGRTFFMDCIHPSLIEAGANIDAQDNDGESALMGACRYRLVDDVKLLLKIGANINLKNNKQQTALDIAKDSIYHYVDQTEKEKCEAKEIIGLLENKIKEQNKSKTCSVM